MSGDAPDYDAPTHEEIADTWRWSQNGASWIASLPGPGSDGAAVNRWMADTVDGLLTDFASLVRVRTAMLLADGPTHVTARPDEPYAQLRTRLTDAIAEHPLPVTFVRLGLDIRVWVRTKDSPDRPHLVWLSYPGVEIGVHLDDSAWVEFSLDNTLFSAFTYPDADPNPLYRFNQPLLEAALRRLRARSTGPLDREGELPGRYEFGFSPNREDY